MTNKDKFLRDGVSIEELTSKLIEYAYKEKKGNLFEITEGFFAQEVKPTLTEDERVILRNLPTNYTKIGRDGGSLEIREELSHMATWHCFYEYNHLFQFIKEGEEYEIKELLQ